jgi:DNA-directed RNA polymerase specialized sigma24 family protein
MTVGTIGGSESEWKQVATVVSRALAFLCLQSTSAKGGSMLEKADFLRGLGLTYADAAEMLGSSEASLKELARLAKKKKGAKRGK